MIVGLIIRLTPGSMIQDMVSFNYTYFFNVLLPPIILNSGYEMQKVRNNLCIFIKRKNFDLNNQQS